MTYDELVELLCATLENREDSFVENIPLIVRNAESTIYNAVRTMDQRKTVTSTVTGGTITPPEDFIEPLYLSVGGVMLMQRQKSFLRTVYGDTTGTPESYSLDYTTLFSGVSTINIAPATAVSTAYELSYAGTPYSIVDQGATYLSVDFPECLFYSCLLEGAIYNKSEVDINATYATKFKENLASLQRSAEGLQLRDEYRNPPTGAS